MTSNISSHTLHLKIDERNHVEKPHLDQLDRPGWGITAIMQDLLTGRKRVTVLLNDTGVISA